jgi:hypothetical protein
LNAALKAEAEHRATARMRDEAARHDEHALVVARRAAQLAVGEGDPRRSGSVATTARARSERGG